jgi:hypothetical protein
MVALNPLLLQEHEPPPSEIFKRVKKYEVKWIDNSILF